MQPQGALSFTELVLNASFLVQCVMLFLLALSIASWTIIISRNNQYRIGRAKADAFEDRFWSGIDLNNLYKDCMKRPDELVGLEVIYSAGFKEFVRLVNSGPADQDVVMDGTYRQMKVACSREVELLETHLPTLATIGSISPYIGLFGTVWGIMHAFVALAAVKNATLAMVAPPIAEALIATAMGLFAAIPAVMFYNRFVTKVEALENRYYNFMDEFSTILNRRLVTIRSQLNRPSAQPNAPYVSQESVAANMGSSPNGNDLSAMNNLNALNPAASSNSQSASDMDTNAYESYSSPASSAPSQSDTPVESEMVTPAVSARPNSDSASTQAKDFAKSMHAPSAPKAHVNATIVNGATPAALNAAPMSMNVNRMSRDFGNTSAPKTSASRQALGGVNAVSGQNINSAAFNDPSMAANYRGIVPPRTNNQALNNAHLPGGSGVMAKGAPSSVPRQANAGNYRSNYEFENKAPAPMKTQHQEPQYITPGAHAKRRGPEN